MQLHPAELGEGDWEIVGEKVWTSRVLIDSSTHPGIAPQSTMAVRQYGTAAGTLEGFSSHIIPLPSKAQAEALSVTLLGRFRPNPHSKVTELSQRWLDGIQLRGTTNVKAEEKDTVGMGKTGRLLNIVGVVDNIAFGVGYGSLGDGWTQDRFVGVAQLQADKIRSKLAAG